MNNCYGLMRMTLFNMDNLPIIKKQCGRYEFINYPAMIFQIVNMAQSEYDSIRARQSQVDLELCDLLHYLENDSLPAHKIAKVGSEIRKRRIERREIKATVSYLDKLIKALNGNKCKYALQELQASYVCEYNDAEYKPRILNVEQEFFAKD